ncbi:MAG: hypothetical protein RMK52_05905 [Chitinophagales bacterium]|nr:hypothetical protein [Chitinophagales bacterium]MDW8393761.1 hypothetical protein [Chitinophagales bacterium]
MRSVAFISSLLLLLAATSCKKTDRSRLTGTWRVADMRFEYLDRQKDFMQRQIDLLTDSLARTADSVVTAQLSDQIQIIRDRADELKANEDSMYLNRWIFRADGTFEAQETGGSRTGIWSYDPLHQRLFTVIDEQTASVEVRFQKDTLKLQLDSVNYMSFVRVE